MSGLLILSIPRSAHLYPPARKQHHTCMQGERDYALIKGQTGPLVYPAGFLYIHSALHQMTAGGNIMLAQTIFTFIYLTNQAVVMQLYITSHAVPPWALVLLCLSKRVKSIFLLRMFNDGVTTLLVNIALLLLIRRKWRWSLVIFSTALSVKMNVLQASLRCKRHHRRTADQLWHGVTCCATPHTGHHIPMKVSPG